MNDIGPFPLLRFVSVRTNRYELDCKHFDKIKVYL